MNEDENDKSKTSGNKKDRHNCCVPQCSAVRSDIIHLHRFPQDQDLKKKWIIAIKTGKVSDHMRVCSRHFKTEDYLKTTGTGRKLSLKKGVIPTENLPKKSLDKQESSPVKRKRAARSDRAMKRALWSPVPPSAISDIGSGFEAVMFTAKPGLYELQRDFSKYLRNPDICATETFPD